MIALLDQAASLLLGPFWFAGSVLLGGGALFAWLARIPSWRVRITELSFVGMVAWLALALVPLPRLSQAKPVAPMTASVAIVGSEPKATAPGPVIHARSTVAAMPVASGDLDAAAANAWHWPTIRQLWLAGAGISFAFLLFGFAMLARLLAGSRRADADVMLLAKQLGDRLGLKGSVDVRVHRRIRAPFCCHLRTVVLPVELLHDRNALRAVLAHELAHVVAADPLRRTVLAVLTPVFVLHPAWWLLRRLSTQASEEAADARAALALGRTAKNYARPLIELSERLGHHGVAPLHPSIVGVLGQPTSFTRRMTMLLTRDPAMAVRSWNRRQGFLATASTLLVLSLSVGTWGTPAAAQSRVVPGDAQDPAAASPLNQRIRPDFRNCRLRDALREIAEQTQLLMAIDTDVAARKIKISRLSLGEMPARRLLDTLAVAHGLRWQMEAGRVVFRVALPAMLPIGDPLKSASAKRVEDPFESLNQGRINLNTANEQMQYRLRSENLFSMGKFEAALQACDRQLAHNPDQPKVLRLKGEILQAMGDQRGAAESLDRTHVFDPADNQKHATELFHQGRMVEALQACEQLLRRDPNQASVLRLRTNALRALGDEAEAKASFERARALDPASTSLQPTRDQTYINHGLKAKDTLESSSDPANNLKRARQLLNAGRVQEAVNECNRQLQLNPDQSSTLRLRADAWRLLGEETAANESLKRAKAIDDSSRSEKQIRQAASISNFVQVLLGKF